MVHAAASLLDGPRPKPFLKWAGGKTQLLPEILARFPARYGRYYEPFMGGGAVFFGLEPHRATLSDLNGELVETYRVIRDDVVALINALKRHRATEEHFYATRAVDPATLTPVQRAARTIFLNRTCFNGLYRVNRSGKFNVPFGKYKNPRICDEPNLRRVAAALRRVDIEVRDALNIVEHARQGDLVYFDPPYVPLSNTASFTAYTRSGFGPAEQERLAEVFAELADRGVFVVLSNSDTPIIRKLYKGFQLDQVMARRAINSRGDRRGQVSELLITAG